MAGLATLSWIKRPSKYRNVLNGTIDLLEERYPRVTFSGAMYLPYAKGEKSQHCSEGVNVTCYNVNGGNYVVRYTTDPSGESALNSTWNKDVMPKKDNILDYVFSAGDNLCERVRSKLEATVIGERGFPGYTAVACGKKFVWYQLAYKYFTAAAIAGKKARVINSTTVNSYNPNCGQMIFFP